jgi:cytochrome c oxidase subunit 4
MAHPETLEQLIRQENQRYHTFINLALILAMLTGIEIILIFLPWPFWLLMTILMVLSTVKFIAVILWFMHLIYDKILCFWLFMSGLVIAAGTMIALIALADRKDVDDTAFADATPVVRDVRNVA